MTPLSSQESLEDRGQRILCVDDDFETLKLRRLLLESAGYAVLTAPSGQEALALLSQRSDVDLVVLDYVMPGMNGDVLAGKLREQFPHLPLIAVSAVGQLPTSLVQAVNRHLQKGQDPEILLSTVAAVLDAPLLSRGHDPHSGPRTVLCVEDEELQLRLRKLLFESAGFRVLQARSAAAALELFQSQTVDAVLMDYWLCGKNGTTAAEEMKRLRPTVPIVMLSGFSSLPGEGSVVDAWLRKGEVEPEDVVDEVRRLISHRSDMRDAAKPQ